MEFVNGGQRKAELANHRLDIVRDCSDLAGSFPENVSIEFVLWRHGSSQALPETLDIAGVAQAVKGADVVAVEVAEMNPKLLADGETPKAFVERECVLLNKTIGGGRTAEEDEEYEDKFTALSDNGMAIWNNLLDLGLLVHELPRFIPVDTYADTIIASEQDTYVAFMSEPSDQTLFNAARQKRHREATVLRQVHACAETLAEDGQDHRIAVLMGAGHSLISVAAWALGANVQRTFLCPPVTDVWEVIERTYRLSGLASDHPPDGFVTGKELALVRGALTMGEMTDEVYKLVYGHKYPLETYDRQRVALLSLQVAGGKATSHQREVWENYQHRAEAYLGRGKIGRKIGRSAMRRSLLKYEEMLQTEARRFK